ncbi:MULTISPECIES: tripartite tricarboxylate transporter substrate binding protein [unclassified Variovorax]|uniref:Bug family tripartite tricarboxylate transporter substrate binding protein n=1 Tax=unclassified Variovorax TaxID=663243 RepID=UPI0025762393|nr:MULTISPECIES: tripartite tricarboxylate transporter substrate binding protein [unclassified Variovorax]MDM0087970.1 tripartite tricarboxylate transporter substrate binding protein [Variovorax sp. J22G40]MDM0146043.1 tripartite tricarboxylate transporter substrate binding protein [Variovorax sp. J2P1-31]
MFNYKKSFVGSRVAAAIIGGYLALAAQHAVGQEFPSKIITIKVGYPAGGSADTAIRPLQTALQTALGQTVIIENLPGVAGSLAAQAALRAPADGHTLLVMVGSDLIINPLVLSSARYKSTDFRLIHPLIFSDMVLVTGHDSSPSDFDAFVEQSRAAKKEFSFGNWGTGSMAHLAAGDLASQTGIKVIDVPYKGTAPMIGDLIGKQIDFTFLPLAGPAQKMIDSGKLKPIGVASKTRASNLPNVKASTESKYLKNFEYTAWIGVFVPEGTPAHIATKLNTVFAKLVNEQKYQQWSRETGNRPMVEMGLEQANTVLNTERDRSTSLVRAMKITPQ